MIDYRSNTSWGTIWTGRNFSTTHQTQLYKRLFLFREEDPFLESLGNAKWKVSKGFAPFQQVASTKLWAVSLSMCVGEKFYS